MRILVPVRSQNRYLSPISYYRSVLPLRTLEKHRPNDYEVVVATAEQLIRYGSNLNNFDVYYLARVHAADERGLYRVVEFVNPVKKSGARIVFDTDDDLTGEFRDLHVSEGFLAIAKEADTVTVSTPYLARQIEKHIKHKPHVLPNYLDTDWFSKMSLRAKRQHEGLTVGFIGTSSHYGDWETAALGLKRIIREFPDVTAITAGYCPDYLRELIPGIVDLPPVPYIHYPLLMAQFDIVCCALDPDDGFCLSKSSIKALEAMAAARLVRGNKVGGAVPVCTSMAVYRRVIANKHNGLLVKENTADGWYQALRVLASDNILRQKIAVQGHRWVKKHRDINTHYKEWEKILRETI